MERYEVLEKSSKKEWDTTFKVTYNQKKKEFSWKFKTIDDIQIGIIKLDEQTFPEIKLGYPDDNGIRTKIIRIFSGLKDEVIKNSEINKKVVTNSKKGKKVVDSSVTNDTNVTDDTNDTNDTNPFVTLVLRDKDIIQDIFRETTPEKILMILATSSEAFTYDKLAEKIGKTVDNIKQTINRINRENAFIDKNKPNGKICHVSLSRMGVEEITQRITNYQEKIAVEKELEDRENKKEEARHTAKENIIIEFKGFCSAYKNIIKDAVQKGKYKIVIIDFNDLCEFSPILSELLLEDPDNTIKLFEVVIIESGLINECRIRFKNLPTTECVMVENIRTKHINKFISIHGKVLLSSDVRPQTVNAKFECPGCGTIISVIQMEKKFREPNRCSCGRRGGFKLINKDMVDTARFVLQDIHENSLNSNPKRLNCFVKEDLASSEILNILVQGGNDIIANGVLKEIPVPLPHGGLSTRFELALEVNYIQLAEEEINLSKLTEEEIEEFEQLASRIDKIGLSELTPSFAPVVKGHEYVKQALILYTANMLNNPGIDEERNKSNYLLIGDPSTAKSVLARFLVDVLIGAKKVVGGSSSAVGITGAAVKDEFLGGWMINPGALVLAKDLLFLEELNTMADEEKDKIQDAMESQYVDITKANASGRFKVRTGIVACANPLKGHFVDAMNKQEIIKQFNIPSPILSRFDAIFLFRDKADYEKDFEISRSMKKRKNKLLTSEFSKEFLKKFFFYIKSQKEPKMDEDFEVLSAQVYSKIRSMSSNELNINARVSEAIDRMCVASAKTRRSIEVEEKDLERVVNILANSYFAIPEYVVIKNLLDQEKQ